MSNVVDLAKHKMRKALILSHRRGTITAAMPKERIRSIAESMERVNRVFAKLKSEQIEGGE